MQVSRFLLLFAGGLVILVLLGVVLFASRTEATPLGGPPFLHQTPGPMHPAHGMTPPPGAALQDPSVVEFSVADVRNYVLAHGFVGGHILPGHKLKILSIQLMTPQQADAHGAELEGFKTAKKVYVVHMEGPFDTSNVKAPVPLKKSTVLTGYEIFDAHTGDMLEWSL